jgi:hypothetical protein
MAKPELLTLLGIVDDMLALMNERARRDGSYRPEDRPRERDLDDRTLKMRERLLADWRSNLVSGQADAHLRDAVTVGSA